MFDKITALGYGVVVFAIILGVGTIVLTQFGNSIAVCSGVPAGFFNSTTNRCENSTGATGTPTGGWVNTNYMVGQLGSTGGGLATWTPAVIALSIGLLFLGAFVVGRGGKGRY